MPKPKDSHIDKINKLENEIKELKSKQTHTLNLVQKSFNLTKSVGYSTLNTTKFLASKTLVAASKIKEPIEPLARELGEDFRVDTQNIVGLMASRINPVFGYIAGKAYTAYKDKAKDMFSSLKDKLSQKLTKDEDFTEEDDELDKLKQEIKKQDTEKKKTLQDKIKANEQKTKIEQQEVKETLNEIAEKRKRGRPKKGVKRVAGKTVGAAQPVPVLKEANTLIIDGDDVGISNINATNLNVQLNSRINDINNLTKKVKNINNSQQGNNTRLISKTNNNEVNQIDNTRKESIKEVVSETVKESIEQSTDKSIKETIKESVKESIKESTDKLVKESEYNKFGEHKQFVKSSSDILKLNDTVKMLNTQLSQLSNNITTLSNTTNTTTQGPKLLGQRINNIQDYTTNKINRSYQTPISSDTISSINRNEYINIQAEKQNVINRVIIEDFAELAVSKLKQVVNTIVNQNATLKGLVTESDLGTKVAGISYPKEKGMIETDPLMLNLISRMLMHVRQLRFLFTGERESMWSKWFGTLKDKFDDFAEKHRKLMLVVSTLYKGLSGIVKTALLPVKYFLTRMFKGTNSKYVKDLGKLPASPLEALIHVSIQQYVVLRETKKTIANIGKALTNRNDLEDISSKGSWLGALTRTFVTNPLKNAVKYVGSSIWSFIKKHDLKIANKRKKQMEEGEVGILKKGWWKLTNFLTNKAYNRVSQERKARLISWKLEAQKWTYIWSRILTHPNLVKLFAKPYEIGTREGFGGNFAHLEDILTGMLTAIEYGQKGATKSPTIGFNQPANDEYPNVIKFPQRKTPKEYQANENIMVVGQTYKETLSALNEIKDNTNRLSTVGAKQLKISEKQVLESKRNQRSYKRWFGSILTIGMSIFGFIKNIPNLLGKTLFGTIGKLFLGGKGGVLGSLGAILFTNFKKALGWFGKSSLSSIFKKGLIQPIMNFFSSFKGLFGQLTPLISKFGPILAKAGTILSLGSTLIGGIKAIKEDTGDYINKKGQEGVTANDIFNPAQWGRNIVHSVKGAFLMHKEKKEYENQEKERVAKWRKYVKERVGKDIYEKYKDEMDKNPSQAPMIVSKLVKKGLAYRDPKTGVFHLTTTKQKLLINATRKIDQLGEKLLGKEKYQKGKEVSKEKLVNAKESVVSSVYNVNDNAKKLVNKGKDVSKEKLVKAKEYMTGILDKFKGNDKKKVGDDILQSPYKGIWGDEREFFTKLIEWQQSKYGIKFYNGTIEERKNNTDFYQLHKDDILLVSKLATKSTFDYIEKEMKKNNYIGFDSLVATETYYDYFFKYLNALSNGKQLYIPFGDPAGEIYRQVVDGKYVPFYRKMDIITNADYNRIYKKQFESFYKDLDKYSTKKKSLIKGRVITDNVVNIFNEKKEQAKKTVEENFSKAFFATKKFTRDPLRALEPSAEKVAKAQNYMSDKYYDLLYDVNDFGEKGVNYLNSKVPTKDVGKKLEEVKKQLEKSGVPDWITNKYMTAKGTVQPYLGKVKELSSDMKEELAEQTAKLENLKTSKIAGELKTAGDKTTKKLDELKSAVINNTTIVINAFNSTASNIANSVASATKSGGKIDTTIHDISKGNI
jgi:hypothetical protein